MATKISVTKRKMFNDDYVYNTVVSEDGYVIATKPHTTDPIQANKNLSELKQQYPDAEIEDQSGGEIKGDLFTNPNSSFYVDHNDPQCQSTKIACDAFEASQGSSGQKPAELTPSSPAGPPSSPPTAPGLVQLLPSEVLHPSVTALQEKLKNTPSSMRTAPDNPNFATKFASSPGKTNKKAIDYCGLPDQVLEDLKSIPEEDRQSVTDGTVGMFGGMRVQAMTKRVMVESEVVVGRGLDNNAYIVIGNDRVEKPHTGFGGAAHTQSDAIDIVAGLGGYCHDEAEKIGQETGYSLEINPNFFVDAARIYVTQKTNVDKNFGIGRFSKGNGLEEKSGKYGGKSAVVAKADNIRLIGRESMRLVTGTDEFNSVGGKIRGKHGIELMAMNDHKSLQPLVLGDNLEIALTTIVDAVESVMQIFHAHMKYQMKFNKAITNHTHHSPFFGIPTTPSPALIPAGLQCDLETMIRTELSVTTHSTNLAGIRTNYLTAAGDNYICSELNKTN